MNSVIVYLKFDVNTAGEYSFGFQDFMQTIFKPIGYKN